MKDGPAFQVYASDFYIDTASWTPTEVGIYWRLLMSEWVNGPLPNDTERLARIAGIDHGNFRKLWCPIVGGKFIDNGDGTLVNNRLEQVRENQRKYRKSQAEKGRKSADKRWKDKVTGVITAVEPVLQPEGNSSSSSSSSSSVKDKDKDREVARSEKPKRPTSPAPDEEFWKEVKKIYYWIDVDFQIQKMKGYQLSPKGRRWKMTRQRVIEWMNREDKPLDVSKIPKVELKKEYVVPDWTKEAVEKGWKL